MIPALTPETLAVEYALLELLNDEPADRHWRRRLAWEGNPQGTARSLWRLHRLQLQGLLNEEEQEILEFLYTSPAETGCAETSLAEAVRALETLRACLLAEAEERERQADELDPDLCITIIAGAWEPEKPGLRRKRLHPGYGLRGYLNTGLRGPLYKFPSVPLLQRGRQRHCVTSDYDIFNAPR